MAVLRTSSTAGRTHSLQQWSARFVRNLYSDGQPMVRDRTLLERPLYRGIRQRVVRRRLQRPVIVTIKLLHTAIFLVIMGFVVQATLSGIRDRIGRCTAVSTVVVIGEGRSSGSMGVAAR